MTFVAIFFTSGLAMILLLARPFFISNLISKGDIHARRFYHRVVHFYSEGKEKIGFILKRKIPLHSKNSSNKFLSLLKEKKGKFISRMRDSRLLKKSDGISEFFKNMSNIEKGNGEIHDTFQDNSQDKEKEVR